MVILALSTRLKELRHNSNLNQEQVAKRVGVNKKTISAYENDLRQPSLDVLISIARVYGVSTDYLLGIQRELVIDATGLEKEEFEAVRTIVSLYKRKNKK